MSLRLAKLFCIFGMLLSVLCGCASKDPYADYRPPEIGSYSEDARRRLADIDRQRKELEEQRQAREQEDVRLSSKDEAKARKAAEKKAAEQKKQAEKEAERVRKAELKAQQEAAEKQAELDRKAERESAASVDQKTSEKRGWFGRKKKTETPEENAERPPKKDPDVPPSHFGPYELQSGDAVMISIQVFPTSQQHEDVIDEDGMITLPYLGNMRAAGKTSSALERAIEKAYQDAKIYKIITVKVVVPTHSYYVRGEVKKPGRFQLTSDGVSILQAIASAGGYTEYAKHNVILIRNGKSYPISLKELDRHPEKDWPLQPGDVLTVERSWL